MSSSVHKHVEEKLEKKLWDLKKDEKWILGSTMQKSARKRQTKRKKRIDVRRKITTNNKKSNR